MHHVVDPPRRLLYAQISPFTFSHQVSPGNNLSQYWRKYYMPSRKITCMKNDNNCIWLKGECLIFGFSVQNIGLQNGSTQDLPFWCHLEYVIGHVSLKLHTQGPRAGSKWQRYKGPGYEVGVTAFAHDIIDRMFSDRISTHCIFPGLDQFCPVLVRLSLTELFWRRWTVSCGKSTTQYLNQTFTLLHPVSTGQYWLRKNKLTICWIKNSTPPHYLPFHPLVTIFEIIWIHKTGKYINRVSFSEYMNTVITFIWYYTKVEISYSLLNDLKNWSRTHSQHVCVLLVIYYKLQWL